MIDSMVMESIRYSIERYKQIGPEFTSQSQRYVISLFEEVETLRKALSQRLQQLEEARACLQGIASCSTCEACRGAAQSLLHPTGESQK